jgi:uncharacterized protein
MLRVASSVGERWPAAARLGGGVAVVLLVHGALGCASHADATRAARSALDAGQPEEALAQLNQKLEVSSAKDIPSPLKDDQVLFVLDRAMVLSQLGQHALASRDLEVADKQLMVLDFSHNAGHDLGKYLFSDDTGPYRAPAYEKLLVNTVNMMSYLSRGLLSGARVEARRLAVLGEYFKNSGAEAQAFIGPGSYLAGFVFEKSGRPDEAIHYYDDALRVGRFPSLVEPIQRLAAQSSYRTPRITAFLTPASGAPAESGAPSESGAPTSTPAPSGGGASPAESAAPSTPAPASVAPTTSPAALGPNSAEILVIVNYGRVPAKVAERVPIGLALTYASTAMSPADQAQANRLALQGLVTWVNYPSLEKTRPLWGPPKLSIDGYPCYLDGGLAVDEAARSAWEEVKGSVVASAITRTITRVIAGEVVRKSTNDGALGLLLSLGTQATLTAADTPDTRSWSTLPARITIGRAIVTPGTHVVRVTVRGETHDRTVSLAPGGWAVVVSSVLR